MTHKMTESILYSKLNPVFSMASILKISKIFDASIMNRALFTLKGVTIHKRVRNSHLRENAVKSGLSTVEVICKNRVDEENALAKHTVRAVIHALDYDENMWDIAFTVQTKVNILFNNQQELTDISLHLIKGILDGNKDFCEEFEIFPDVLSNISYQHSGKKCFESLIKEVTKVFISESK